MGKRKETKEIIELKALLKLILDTLNISKTRLVKAVYQDDSRSAENYYSRMMEGTAIPSIYELTKFCGELGLPSRITLALHGQLRDLCEKYQSWHSYYALSSNNKSANEQSVRPKTIDRIMVDMIDKIAEKCNEPKAIGHRKKLYEYIGNEQTRTEIQKVILTGVLLSGKYSLVNLDYLTIDSLLQQEEGGLIAKKKANLEKKDRAKLTEEDKGFLKAVSKREYLIRGYMKSIFEGPDFDQDLRIARLAGFFGHIEGDVSVPKAKDFAQKFAEGLEISAKFATFLLISDPKGTTYSASAIVERNGTNYPSIENFNTRIADSILPQNVPDSVRRLALQQIDKALSYLSASRRILQYGVAPKTATLLGGR